MYRALLVLSSRLDEGWFGLHRPTAGNFIVPTPLCTEAVNEFALAVFCVRSRVAFSKGGLVCTGRPLAFVNPLSR